MYIYIYTYIYIHTYTNRYMNRYHRYIRRNPAHQSARTFHIRPYNIECVPVYKSWHTCE